MTHISIDSWIVVKLPILIRIEPLFIYENDYPSFNVKVDYFWENKSHSILGSAVVNYSKADWINFKNSLKTIASDETKQRAKLVDDYADLIIAIEKTSNKFTFSLEYWISRSEFKPHFFYRTEIDTDILVSISDAFDNYPIWYGENRIG